MAARLPSLVVLLSLGICAGEGLDAGAMWGGVEVEGVGLPSLAVPGVPAPVSGPSPGTPPQRVDGERFAEEPRDVVVRKGADAVLACSAAPAYASWPVSWHKDGQPVPLDDREHFVMDRSGNLVIHQVSRSGKDVGEYRCVLSSPKGEGVILSRAANLHVASLAHVVHGPDNITVPIGGTARFRCSVDSVPAAKITWRRNEEPLPVNPRYVVLSSGVLLISSVESSDGGVYKCITTNNMLKRSRASNDAILRISPLMERLKDRFLFQEKVIQSVVGENVTLECSVSWNYLPSWTFNGKSRFVNQPIFNMTLPGISILTFHDININHSGTYTCSVNSSEVLSQTIELEVLTPPFIVESPDSQIHPTARTARFHCNFSGNPLPSVTWYKNGTRVKTDGRIKLLDQELLISNSVASDTGFYQCVARNNVGESWGLAHLYVNSSGLQGPPMNLACHKRGENFIIVNWSPPLYEIKAYTVHYWPSQNNMDYRQTLTVKNSVNVTELKPFTNYTFLVRSYVTRGASEPSQEITCETRESVPDVAPEVSCSILSSTKVHVSWLPLGPAQTYGQVTGYKVQWRLVTRSTAKVKEVSANVLNFTISDLVSGSRYEIRVLARTNRGWPVPSVEDKLAWTPVQMPPEALTPPTEPNSSAETPKNVIIPLETILEPPTGLEAEPTSPHGINLTWSPPSAADCKNYSVFVQEVHSNLTPGGSKPYIINCTNHWIEICNLQPNTMYELMLKVHDSYGDSSPFSEKIECKTLEDAPEKVTEVTWEPLNTTSIKVMWRESESTISQFNVSLVAQGKSDTVYFLVNGSRSSVEVHGMNPATPYQLRVSGISRGGTGLPSDPHIVLLTPPPTVRHIPTGEQFASESHDYPLMFVVTTSIFAAITVLVVLGYINILLSARRRGPVTSTLTPIPFQPNGHGLHAQMPLTSFVTPDPSMLRHQIGVRRIDTESHDGSDSKGAEESSVTLLPAGTAPTPIGANCLHHGDNCESADGLKTSPTLSGILLPRHMFHITENPQFDSKSQMTKYGHNCDEHKNPEEMVTLLPATQLSSYASDAEDECGDVEDDAMVDSLNMTQVTDVDHSFQDKSNNNFDIHKSNVSTISSHSGTSDGCGSSRSNSFLGETSEDSNDLTEQQLLVTLSSIPLHHLTTTPFTDIPKVSVLGPNG